jgi:uncharacterized protein (DUF2225 family)
MPWNFAYSSLDRRWAVLHDHVVVANKQPLQKGELIKDAHDWFFFTESNVTVAWLGTLLRYELAEREKPAAKREMGRRESSPKMAVGDLQKAVESPGKGTSKSKSI